MNSAQKIWTNSRQEMLYVEPLCRQDWHILPAYLQVVQLEQPTELCDANG